VQTALEHLYAAADAGHAKASMEAGFLFSER
jgi:hypothetical protein